jgi:murein DD-endopeptidase MepM/ murein hydrolase activator NlpD
MATHGSGVMNKIIVCILITCFTSTIHAETFYPKFGLKFNDPYTADVGGGNHTGVDIMVPIGTPVHSMAGGKVTFSRSLNVSPTSPPVIVVDHGNGISSYYHHIDNVKISIGDTVMQGQVIAETALTGAAGRHTNMHVRVPHFHLTVTNGGMFSDPLALNLQCLDASPKYIWPVGCK